MSLLGMGAQDDPAPRRMPSLLDVVAQTQSTLQKSRPDPPSPWSRLRKISSQSLMKMATLKSPSQSRANVLSAPTSPAASVPGARSSLKASSLATTPATTPVPATRATSVKKDEAEKNWESSNAATADGSPNAQLFSVDDSVATGDGNVQEISNSNDTAGGNVHSAEQPYSTQAAARPALSPRTLALLDAESLAAHRVDKTPGAVAEGRIHMLHPDDFYATEGIDRDLEKEFGSEPNSPTRQSLQRPAALSLGSTSNKVEPDDDGAGDEQYVSGDGDDFDDMSPLTPMQMDILESLDRQYAADGAALHFSIEPVPALEEEMSALKDEDLAKEHRAAALAGRWKAAGSAAWGYRLAKARRRSLDRAAAEAKEQADKAAAAEAEAAEVAASEDEEADDVPIFLTGEDNVVDLANVDPQSGEKSGLDNTRRNQAAPSSQKEAGRGDDDGGGGRSEGSTVGSARKGGPFGGAASAWAIATRLKALLRHEESRCDVDAMDTTPSCSHLTNVGPNAERRHSSSHHFETPKESSTNPQLPSNVENSTPSTHTSPLALTQTQDHELEARLQQQQIELEKQQHQIQQLQEAMSLQRQANATTGNDSQRPSPVSNLDTSSGDMSPTKPTALLVRGHQGPLSSLMGVYDRVAHSASSSPVHHHGSLPSKSYSSWRLRQQPGKGRLFRDFADIRLYFARQHQAWLIGAREHMEHGVGWIISGNRKCTLQSGPTDPNPMWHWSDGKQWRHDPGIEVIEVGDDGAPAPVSTVPVPHALSPHPRSQTSKSVSTPVKDYPPVSGESSPEKLKLVQQLRHTRGQLGVATSTLEDALDEIRHLRAENKALRCAEAKDLNDEVNNVLRTSVHDVVDGVEEEAIQERKAEEAWHRAVADAVAKAKEDTRLEFLRQQQAEEDKAAAEAALARQEAERRWEEAVEVQGQRVISLQQELAEFREALRNEKQRREELTALCAKQQQQLQHSALHAAAVERRLRGMRKQLSRYEKRDALRLNAEQQRRQQASLGNSTSHRYRDLRRLAAAAESNRSPFSPPRHGLTHSKREPASQQSPNANVRSSPSGSFSTPRSSRQRVKGDDNGSGIQKSGHKLAIVSRKAQGDASDDSMRSAAGMDVYMRMDHQLRAYEDELEQYREIVLLQQQQLEGSFSGGTNARRMGN